MNRLLLLILGLSICTLSFGQKSTSVSWKAYKKKAEELIQLRQYAKAGAAYEKAFALKPQRGDLLISAADNYMLERDFTNASRVYAAVVDNPKYKSSKLNYAFSLKQSNQFEQAMIVFASCLDVVSGKNAKKEAQINKEIMGCQFALEQAEGFEAKPYDINISQLTANVNSQRPDFAPFHVSETKFYYSTLSGGNASIKSSEWRDGKWSEGISVKGLKGFNGKHLCNAVVSPDESEMFFTVCNDEQVWGGLSSRCEIYVTQNKGKAWSAAKRLSSNINHKDATNTQPFIIEQNGEQQIYFASNRPGGQGGMDLWFSSRPAGDAQAEFGQAINLGPNINTVGNEITPFYNNQEGVLYFSSDGHLTMGGFDVFKAVGDKVKWSPAENMGMPINTGADEKYYTIAHNSTEGYFVSNRAFGDNKLTSTDEDIFTFNILPPHFFVEGLITDQQDLNLIEEVQVYLYELKAKTEDRRLLSTKFAEEGKYNFRLLPNRNYQLSFEAKGYVEDISFLNTNDKNKFLQERNITLTSVDAQSAVASINEVIPADAPATSVEEISPDQPAKTALVEEISAPVATVETIAKKESEFAQRIEAQMEEMSKAREEGLVIGATEEKVEGSAPSESVVIGATEEAVIDNPSKGLVIGATEEKVEDSAPSESVVIGTSEEVVIDNPSKGLVIGATDENLVLNSNKSVVINSSENAIETVNETVAVTNAKEVQEGLVIGATNESSILAKVSSETLTKSSSKAISQATEAEVYIASTIAAENNNLDHTYAATETKNYANFNRNFVPKGNAVVPSGTGIYVYDENNDKYKKEGNNIVSEPYIAPAKNIIINTTAVSEPYTIPDPVYSNSTNASYNNAVVNKPVRKSESPSTNLIMGTTYKVQLIAVEYHNPEHRRYDGIKNLGLSLNTEYIKGKGWTRVLLGSFKTEAEAMSVLDNARSSGFKRAYVVKYKDGQRKERI